MFKTLQAARCIRQNTVSVLAAEIQSHAQPLLEQLQWLPVHQSTDYKLAVLTYNIHSTSTPIYLSRHIRARNTTRHLRSSSILLLHKPTTRTHFADRAFRCTRPSVWNSLNSYIGDSSSLAVFKSRLKTFLPSARHLLRVSLHASYCPPAPLKPPHIGALYKFDYCYYYYCQRCSSRDVLRLSFKCLGLGLKMQSLGLGTQSLGLGLVLDPSSLGSKTRKFKTMYETTIFPKKGHFPENLIFRSFLGVNLRR